MCLTSGKKQQSNDNDVVAAEVQFKANVKHLGSIIMNDTNTSDVVDAFSKRMKHE